MKKTKKVAFMAAACVALAQFASISTARAAVIFSDNFENATLGGVITAPSTNTTGIAPSVGTVFFSKSDDGAVVAGLNGSSKALQGYDNVSGQALRYLGYNFPGGNPTSGIVELSQDFRFDGPLGQTGPLEMGFFEGVNGGYQFIRINIYSTLAIDATGLAYTATSLALGTEYHMTVSINLDSHTYGINIVGVANFTNLAFTNTLGLGSFYDKFGFADFRTQPTPAYGSSSTASVTLDNIVVSTAVPEPSTWVMLSLGMTYLIVSRKRRTNCV